MLPRSGRRVRGARERARPRSTPTAAVCSRAAAHSRQQLLQLGEHAVAWDLLIVPLLLLRPRGRAWHRDAPRRPGRGARSGRCEPSRVARRAVRLKLLLRGSARVTGVGGGSGQCVWHQGAGGRSCSREARTRVQPSEQVTRARHEMPPSAYSLGTHILPQQQEMGGSRRVRHTACLGREARAFRQPARARHGPGRSTRPRSASRWASARRPAAAGWSPRSGGSPGSPAGGHRHARAQDTGGARGERTPQPPGRRRAARSRTQHSPGAPTAARGAPI